MLARIAVKPRKGQPAACSSTSPASLISRSTPTPNAVPASLCGLVPLPRIRLNLDGTLCHPGGLGRSSPEGGPDKPLDRLWAGCSRSGNCPIGFDQERSWCLAHQVGHWCVEARLRCPRSDPGGLRHPGRPLRIADSALHHEERDAIRQRGRPAPELAQQTAARGARRAARRPTARGGRVRTGCRAKSRRR